MTAQAMLDTLIIDVGSTSVKAAALALAAGASTIEVLDERPAPAAVSPRPGRHETDPELFVALVTEIISSAQHIHPGLRRIAFSTQMHGVLLSDRDNIPLSPFLSWQDERILEEVDGISWLERARREIPVEHFTAGGVSPRVGLGGLAIAAWLQEHHDTPAGTRIHTLGSFLIARLAGVYITHLTNAAPLGLVELSTGQWNAELVAALGLDRFELPHIVDGYAPVGVLSGQRGSALQIYPDIGDHQASVLGSGLEPGELAISLGTAGIAACLSDSLARPHPDVEVRPYVKGQYLLVRTRQPGGRAADHFAAAVRELAASVQAEVPRAMLWSAVSSPGDDVWGNLAEGFLTQYTEAYRTAMAQLFGGQLPTQLRLNGGMARHIPWFAQAFGQSLGLQTVSPANEDLATVGVVTLLQQDQA